MSSEETNQSQNFSRSRSDPSGDASSEQKREEIRKVRATKDFYDILGVSKTATKEEITKAYRKLALKFHPDKNKEPGADEAFKKIAQAYDCLTTEDKRMKYDQFGNEEPEQHYNHYRQYYNDDISPDDIFRMFFGNAFFEDNMPRQRFVFRTYNMNMGGMPRQARGEHRQQVNEGASKFLPLLQCLPILIIIIASFGLNFSFSSNEPLYSLSQNYKFPIPRYTLNLRREYFVDKSFDSKIGSRSKLIQFEEEIEKEHINKLQSRCSYMKQQKENLEKMMEFSQGPNKEQYERRVKDIDLAACETINAYKIKFPQLFK